MVEAAKGCHVALIPSDVGDPRKNGASNNRLVTALALGLMPVATMIDAYLPFSECIAEVASGEDSSREILEERHAQLEALQQTMVAPYTFAAVARQWLPVALAA